MTAICEIAKQSDLDALKDEFNAYKTNIEKLFRDEINAYKEITEKQIKYLNFNITACMKVAKIKSIANKFHISNLPVNITDTIIYQYFSEFGNITDIQIIDNKPKIYAFITYENLLERDKLLFNKHKIFSNNIKISNAIQKYEPKQIYIQEPIYYNPQIIYHEQPPSRYHEQSPSRYHEQPPSRYHEQPPGYYRR
jgi:RNA recognition motif-containing protein